MLRAALMPVNVFVSQLKQHCLMQDNATDATLRAAMGAKAKEQALLLLDNADSIAAADSDAQVDLTSSLLPPLLGTSPTHQPSSHASTHLCTLLPARSILHSMVTLSQARAEGMLECGACRKHLMAAVTSWPPSQHVLPLGQANIAANMRPLPLHLNMIGPSAGMRCLQSFKQLFPAVGSQLPGMLLLMNASLSQCRSHAVSAIFAGLCCLAGSEAAVGCCQELAAQRAFDIDTASGECCSLATRS